MVDDQIIIHWNWVYWIYFSMTYLSHSKTQKPISYSKSRIETLGNHVKYPVRNQE